MLKKFSKHIVSMPLKRLIALFVALSTLLLLASIFSFYYSFYNASLETSYEYMDNAISETADSIESKLDNVSSAMLTLAYSEEVYDEFINVPAVQKFETGRIIRVMLSNFSDNDPLISGIVMKLKDGQSLLSDSISGYKSLYALSDTIVEDYDLTQPFKNVTFTNCYKDFSSEQMYFACLVPIYNSTGGALYKNRYEGAYIALCATRNLIDNEKNITSLNSILAVIESEKIIFSNSSVLMPKHINTLFETNSTSNTAKLDNVLYQIRTGKVETTGWDIIFAISDSELRSGLDSIRLWGIILSISIVIVQLLMGYTLRRSIVKPLSNIVGQVHNVGKGNYLSSITIPDGSEIGILAVDIKNMLLRIDKMNKEMIDTTKALYQAKYDRLSAQIMFLQAQINPHFLYNNLECIRGMASSSNTKKIREMTRAMADIYRYCVSAGQISTIRQELDIVKRFLDIMTMRNTKKFIINIQIEEAVLERPIPKMTLQPIVENIFQHGIIGSKAKGIINIDGYDKKGATIISVSDNGTGIEANIMKKINEHLLNSTMSNYGEQLDIRIGIYNVNSRIQSIFGEDYGIIFQPNKPHGLRVVIRLGENLKTIDGRLEMREGHPKK